MSSGSAAATATTALDMLLFVVTGSDECDEIDDVGRVACHWHMLHAV